MTAKTRDQRARALASMTLLMAGAAGCATEQTSPTDDTVVGRAYDALAAKLGECEDAKRSCRDATSCAAAELEACEASFDSCREVAKEEREALRDAVHACHEAKHACEAEATDAAARETCRAAHDACAKTTRPSEPPCHAELRACLDEARDEDAPDADPAAPATGDDSSALPAVDEGDCVPPPGRSAAKLACHEREEACLLAELAANPPPAPPKCGPNGPQHDHPARADAGPPPPRPEKDDAGVRPRGPRACPPGLAPRPPKKPKPTADAGL